MQFTYDVAVIGGAFSGAAAALLVKRRRPGTRVLIVEKAAQFDRKVGESTTEVSSCFLTRVLGLTQYLAHHQLPKQGLRMWFARGADDAFCDAVEMGAMFNSRLVGFQVDRSTLDEHLLALAVDSGCELWRPAKVGEIKLHGADGNELAIRVGEETRRVRARWIIDASGRAALIARQLGVLRTLAEHPVNALWARFSAVKDWDGLELRARFPAWADATKTARGLATNHLMGLGWWCWIIPLKGGDTSVGLVYDTRLFQPPAGATIGERLQAHFQSHPVGREILGNAQPIAGDQRAYSALAYACDRVAGEGWVLAGDAAGFIDPLYSPGLDFCSFTAHGAHGLITRALDGEPMGDCIAEYNARFAFCFRSWFDAIYRDKYYYLGDAELMSAAWLLDIASYHLGPVRQVYADPAREFGSFPFGGVPGRIAARVLRFFNARLVHLARRKIAAGCYAAENSGWRLLVGGFLPDASVLRLVGRGLGRWLRAEWRGLLLREPIAPRSPVLAEARE
jgi:flavin-dependent dehydrogenase